MELLLGSLVSRQNRHHAAPTELLQHMTVGCVIILSDSQTEGQQMLSSVFLYCSLKHSGIIRITRGQRWRGETR